MSYYPEPGSHIKDKVKVVLDLSNCALETLNDATGVDKSNLDAKRGSIALKAEVFKLDVNKLVKVATGLNNLKTKVDILVGKNIDSWQVENFSCRNQKIK